jgi:hypothetical protein
MWCVDAMSDSPPERDLEMHRRPTRSAPSVWKNCLPGGEGVSELGPLKEEFLPGVLLGGLITAYLLGVGAVDTHSILLSRVFAEVFDVAEDMATAVLTVIVS